MIVSSPELKKILQSEKVQLLDVRRPDEFEEGFISLGENKAININIQDIDFTKKATESLNKDERVFVYCRSGVRSLKAQNILKKLGFKSVINLTKGYLDWQSQS